MRRALPAIVTLSISLCLSLSGCNDARSEPPARERATGRALDSIVAESPLPGARGIMGAHHAADAAAGRQAAMDSLAR